MWILLAVLPKYILEHFGRNSSGFTASIINVVYWVLTSIAAYFVGKLLDLYFNKDIVELIRNIFFFLNFTA